MDVLLLQRNKIIDQLEEYKNVYDQSLDQLSAFNQYLVEKMGDYSKDSIELTACYEHFIKNLA